MKAFPILDRLTGGENRFLDDIWGRGHHLARGVFPHQGPVGTPRGPLSGQQGALLSLVEFVELAAERGLRTPVARIVKDGQSLEQSDLCFSDTEASVHIDGLLRPELVSEAVATGHTVVLRNLQHFHPPLRRFCRQFELEMNHPVQANAYLTPAGAGGLAVHHDHHDVFVVQSHGAKEWELYEPAVEAPVDPWDYERDRPGRHTASVVTEAGDCLYMARGVPHAARAGAGPSLHLTLGVRARTWLDVARALVDQAATVEEFRQSLAPGYAADPDALRAGLLQRLPLLANLVDDGFAEHVTRGFWWGRRPPLDGHLLDILGLDQLTIETVVQWRTDHVWRVMAEPTPSGYRNGATGRFLLRLWDRDLVFDDRHRFAVDNLMAGGPIAIADIDQDLPEPDQLLVARRLVEAGVVCVSPSA